MLVTVTSNRASDNCDMCKCHHSFTCRRGSDMYVHILLESSINFRIMGTFRKGLCEPIQEMDDIASC